MALALVENARAAFERGRNFDPAVAGSSLRRQHAAKQATVPSAVLRARGAERREHGSHRQHTTNHWPLPPVRYAAHLCSSPERRCHQGQTATAFDSKEHGEQGAIEARRVVGKFPKWLQRNAESESQPPPIATLRSNDTATRGRSMAPSKARKLDAGNGGAKT